MGISNSGKQIHHVTSVSKDIKLFPGRISTDNKKADMVEHPMVFDHVGLLGNEPPGKTGLLFI
jgi:hypothetical protein